jgi:ABC-type Mn2+/Zn2+ transport system permease subunit
MTDKNVCPTENGCVAEYPLVSELFFVFRASYFGFSMILFQTLLVAIALSAACAVLSVIVVLRRWAFIGEGISHSGFGGAGTAWLLMLAVPSLAQSWFPYLSVVGFSIATALAMGVLSRRRGVNADAAIGIFLVASLAWGFLAAQVYARVAGVQAPPLFDELLFGHVVSVSPQYTFAAVALCLAILITVIGLWKEILAYAFDPLLAQTSGVRAGFIHYLLMVVLALVIIIGIRVAGSVLVTALLVLPGATALLLSRKLHNVVAISTVVALAGAVGGLMISVGWRYLPAGPTMVLIMFVEFLIAYASSHLRPAA